MWDTSAGRDRMETKEEEKEKWKEKNETSSHTVWLLAVSSVDLLCSQPWALASASSTAPCVSLSMEPI